MGFVPEDAEWYLAEIVQELIVADDARNFVWRNLTLVHANSPDEAYEKALELGRAGDTEYLNSAGKLVTIRFRGLAFLDVIHDPLEHGAELRFQSKVSVSPENLEKLVLSKEELQVFRPIEPLEGPDVTSRDVLKALEKRLRSKRSI